MHSPKENILLHSCCAPCSTYVIQQLSEQYRVTALFYNPNIQPQREYEKRLDAMHTLCDITGTELIIADYEVPEWEACSKGLEKEPEGGRRCTVCFEMRLKKTAEIAASNGFIHFTTTLSVSPHKDAECINAIGTELAHRGDMQFLRSDFKKDGGFQKSCELSRTYGLYRQNYCGCLCSIRT